MSILNESKLRNSKNKLNSQINQLMNYPVGKIYLIKAFNMKLQMGKFVREVVAKTIKLSKSAYKI